MAKPQENDEIKKDLAQATDLAAVYTTSGGKQLVEALITDAVGVIETLGSSYKTMPEHELRALCAELKTKLDVARTMTRAAKNKEYLAEMLKDALTE